MRLVDEKGVRPCLREEAANVDRRVEKVVYIAYNEVGKLRIGERELVWANAVFPSTRLYFLYRHDGKSLTVERKRRLGYLV